MSERGWDVAVVGGGPAGIAAAVRVAETGRRVALVDEGIRAGGQIWRGGARHAPAAARRWLRRLDGLAAEGRVRTYPSSTVVDGTAAAGDCSLLVQQATGSFELRAGAVILALGARERFLPFPGWTLPGVVGAGGAQALLKAGLQVKGRRVVVSGTGPLLLAAAYVLAKSGARVLAVAEQAPFRSVAGFAATLVFTPERLVLAGLQRSTFLRAPYRTGTWVSRAVGDGRVEAAVLTDGADSQAIECDLLCVGYSLLPATALGRIFGCRVVDEAIHADEAQRTTVPGVFCAGETTGIAGVESAVTQGEIAGLAAVGAAIPERLLRARERHARFGHRLAAAFALRPELRDLPEPDTIVCRCEDVRHDELRRFTSGGEAKLVTRAGMGACQGRICGGAQRFLYGWSADSVRPPVLPATIATMINEAPPAAEQADG